MTDGLLSASKFHCERLLGCMVIIVKNERSGSEYGCEFYIGIPGKLAGERPSLSSVASAFNSEIAGLFWRGTWSRINLLHDD